MQLSVPILWDEWHQETSGTGSITYNSDKTKVVIDAPNGSYALVYFPMVAYPGDTFRFTVQARITNGGTSCRIRAEQPNGTERDVVIVESEVFKTYELEATTPLYGDGTLTVSEMTFRLGVSTSGDGTVEFINPRVELVRGIGTQRLVASGVLKIKEDNTVEWDDTFHMFGFEASPTVTLPKITIRPSLSIDTKRGSFQIPHMSAPNITTKSDNWDNAAGPIFFGSVDEADATNNFNIRGYDHTGAAVTTYAGKGDRKVLIQLFMQ